MNQFVELWNACAPKSLNTIGTKPLSKARDICCHFADAVANTSYEALPVGAIEAAKKSIVDTVGVILAASGMEQGVRHIIDHVRDAGGKPESTLLGFGGRFPSSAAAFANGAMAHCLDFDDRTSWGSHSGSSLVPVLLAAAERVDHVSGAELIAAMAVGQDMFMRLRRNVGWKQDWNLSTVLGVFSATATACHVLRLTSEQIRHAFGIASLQASGTMQLIHGGGELRGMYAGFSAKAAMTAAQLAQRGLTGMDGVFDGTAGIFSVYFKGDYDLNEMLKGLGQEYLGEAMVYKPWPVVGLAHTYIHATIELMKRHRLKYSDIKQLRVYVGEYQQEMCTPLAIRRKPRAAIDAKFSLPFCVAIAATYGEANIAHFTDVALHDPKVLSVAGRVVPVKDQNASWITNIPEGRVEIDTQDGRTLEYIGTNVPGSPEAPFTWSDIAKKFSDCAAVAVSPWSSKKINRFLDLGGKLETCKRAGELIAVLQ